MDITPLEHDMTETLDEVKELLGRAQPESLLKAYASLTHRLHATVPLAQGDLRVERGLVEEELLRRLNRPSAPVVTEVGLNRAAQEMYTASDGLIQLPRMTDKPKVVHMIRVALVSLGIAVPEEKS